MVNAKGVETKALFVKQMEREYWDIIALIQAQQGCSMAEAIRWALKRAVGR